MARVTGRDKCRGIALPETALIILLLSLLTFGMMEYGWMFLKAQEINNAVRTAARLGIPPDSTTADIEAKVAALMSAAGITSYQISVSPPDISTLHRGEALTVSLSVPYVDIELLGIPIIPVPTNVTASVTMAKEGP